MADINKATSPTKKSKDKKKKNQDASNPRGNGSKNQQVRQPEVRKDSSSQELHREQELKNSSSSTTKSRVMELPNSGKSSVFVATESSGPLVPDTVVINNKKEEEKREKVLGDGIIDPSVTIPYGDDVNTLLEYDPEEELHDVKPMELSGGEEGENVLANDQMDVEKEEEVVVATESSDNAGSRKSSDKQEQMNTTPSLISVLEPRAQEFADNIMKGIESEIVQLIRATVAHDMKLLTPSSNTSSSSLDDRLEKIESSISWLNSLFKPQGEANLINKLTVTCHTHSQSIEDLKQERLRAREDRKKMEEQQSQVNEMYQKLKLMYSSLREYLERKMAALDAESEVWKFLNSELFKENFKELCSSPEFIALKESMTSSALKKSASDIAQDLEHIASVLVRDQVSQAFDEKSRIDLENRVKKRTMCFICKSTEHGPSCTILDPDALRDELAKQNRCILCGLFGCQPDSVNCYRRDHLCEICSVEFGSDRAARLHHPELPQPRAAAPKAKDTLVVDSEAPRKLSKAERILAKRRRQLAIAQEEVDSTKRQKMEANTQGPADSSTAGRVPVPGDKDFQSSSGFSKPN